MPHRTTETATTSTHSAIAAVMIFTLAKAVRIESELARRGHRLRRVGQELVGPCPRCGGRDRFGVNVRKQIWNCRHCGKGGDVIDLVKHLDGATIGEAVRTLTNTSAWSISPTSPPASDAQRHSDDDGLEAAERIWRESIDIKGTPGERYFDRRGIDLCDAPNFGGLRWHPRCPWGQGTAPCVVGRFTNAITGKARGIWRRPIDGGKPRSLGPMAGCVIRLYEDVTTSITVGEGVETVLAVATRGVSRRTSFKPAWAAGSAGNLAQLPILPGIESITILADNDANGRGQQAARMCAFRWKKAGRKTLTFVPREVGDFNDVAMRLT